MMVAQVAIYERAGGDELATTTPGTLLPYCKQV